MTTYRFAGGFGRLGWAVTCARGVRKVGWLWSVQPCHWPRPGCRVCGPAVSWHPTRKAAEEAARVQREAGKPEVELFERRLSDTVGERRPLA